MEPGDFDPSDREQLRRLLSAAVKPYRERLRELPRLDQDEILADAQAAAVEAALTYDPVTAETTKWKHAANAANYAVKKGLLRIKRELPAASFGASGDEDESDGGEGVLESGTPAFDNSDEADEFFDPDDDPKWDIWREEAEQAEYHVERLRQAFVGTLRDEADERIFVWAGWTPSRLSDGLGLPPNTISQRRRRLEQRFEAWLATEHGQQCLPCAEARSQQAFAARQAAGMRRRRAMSRHGRTPNEV